MTPDDPRHGTPRGYRVHRADDEDACDACLRAAARYENQRQLAILEGRALLVDKTPSIRRIRALQAIGWSSRTLSVMLGRTPKYLDVLVTRTGHPTVRASLADDIAELYERLHMTPGSSNSTRLRALAKGWPPPLAWDDINRDEEPYSIESDPDLVDEAVVLRILAGDIVPATTAERREIVRRWPTTGRSLNDLVRLTGWKPERYGSGTEDAA